MIVPQRNHAAWAATEVALDHYCPHCQAVSQGVALGRGSGSSGGFDASASEASAHARQNAQIDAARAMKLVRCPKCGRRDGAEVRGFFARTMFVWGAPLVAVLAGAGFINFAAAGALAGTLLGLGGAALRFWWKLGRSDQVVHFDSSLEDLSRV
jgi:hypothetical protein